MCVCVTKALLLLSHWLELLSLDPRLDLIRTYWSATHNIPFGVDLAVEEDEDKDEDSTADNWRKIVSDQVEVELFLLFHYSALTVDLIELSDSKKLSLPSPHHP